MRKKILVLDNYDSFTYNLVHYVNDFNGFAVNVIRNDKLTLDDTAEYDGIILSPGPGLPADAGILTSVVEHCREKKRIFGVCLGMQAIAEVYGGSMLNLSSVFHGVATPVKITQPPHYLFKKVPSVFEAGRYHSWVVNPQNLPEALKIEATDNMGNIMALSHREIDICGVQFHPESILTPLGKTIIKNWLDNF